MRITALTQAHLFYSQQYRSACETFFLQMREFCLEGLGYKLQTLFKKN